MTNHLEFYRCEICGNIVQVMHNGAGELVCCGKPMTLLESYTKKDEKQEKHVPVFLNENEIQVGSIPHPMLEEHHIEFIQAVSDDKKQILTRFLSINDEPKMSLSENKYTQSSEYCNLHGLWHGDRNI